MKCPKCGYTSFESYDACRKCSADLTGFKKTYGISALVLPPTLLAGATVATAAPQTGAVSTVTGNEMFSFDLPGEQTAAQSTAAPMEPVAPFSFDDAPTAMPAFSFDTPSQPAEHDPFASLLETTPEPQKAASSPQAATPGSFELSNFSWDDTPVPGQSGIESADTSKTADDDFESLFGDLAEPKKK